MKNNSGDQFDSALEALQYYLLEYYSFNESERVYLSNVLAGFISGFESASVMRQDLKFVLGGVSSG